MIDRFTLAFERAFEWSAEDEEWYEAKYAEWMIHHRIMGDCQIEEYSFVYWMMTYCWENSCEDMPTHNLFGSSRTAVLLDDVDLWWTHKVSLTESEAEELLDDDIRRIQDQRLAINGKKKSETCPVCGEDIILLRGLWYHCDYPAERCASLVR